jgi:type IV secretory pathway TraG/TraD family ATPase VirD4
MTVQRDAPPPTGQNLLIGAIICFGGLFGLLWAAGVSSAWLSGHAVPHGHPAGAFTAFAHPGDPSAAWHAPVGAPVLYWAVLILFLATAAAMSFFGWRACRVLAVRDRRDPTRLPGLASRREVAAAAGPKALLRRAATLRPSVSRPAAREIGYPLGSSRGVTCWASVEDSMVLLGPPRSGKGLHLVIPLILDAPGAVITTSTRPDNLAVTMQARASGGRPVAVFDPQRLAPGVVSATRWSPIRGCENPQVAMTRARALTADPAGGVENSSFWSQQCYTAVRCLLHAAALGQRQPAELFHWSVSPVAAADAVTILESAAAAPGWSAGLDAILSADPRTRDSTWAMVSNTFAPLADPAVLDAVSPGPGEQFDPAAFLREKGTLYLLGTSTGASATAGLVAAFIEDVAEAARRIAAASPGARLDPPLALVLDEGANYPIPSLPALMSDGGGTGITTSVVLQSLAQARSRWGQQDAAAIWDSAIVKVVLGGSGNAADLRDLSALLGSREDQRVNTSWGHDGKRSFSMSSHDKPILDPGQLRTLRFGNAVLLLRSAPPIMLHLRSWTARRDAASLTLARDAVERAIREASAARPATGRDQWWGG